MITKGSLMMGKKVRFFMAIVFSVITISSVSAQSAKYNPLYGPPKSRFLPIPVCRRLSYENFRNIKLLTSAIMNFGKGDSGIDSLVDEYAEASALYFQGRYNDSAKLFLKNEKAILKVAQNLAKNYRKESEKFLIKGIKLTVKRRIKSTLKGRKGKRNIAVVEKYLNRGKFGINKANDYFVRFINASKASPIGLITGIYYYRKAKKSLFTVFKLQLSPKEWEDFKERNKKAMQDNDNKILG